MSDDVAMSADCSTESPTVFVVEDDAAVRSSLAFVLEMAGFRVETFESGEALLMRAAPTGAGCLVLDERLPGVSGFETLRQLRARQVDLPALFVTSHPKKAFRDRATSAGAPILEKPLTSDDLVSAVEAAIGAHA